MFLRPQKETRGPGARSYQQPFFWLVVRKLLLGSPRNCCHRQTFGRAGRTALLQREPEVAARVERRDAAVLIRRCENGPSADAPSGRLSWRRQHPDSRCCFKLCRVRTAPSAAGLERLTPGPPSALNTQYARRGYSLSEPSPASVPMCTLAVKRPSLVEAKPGKPT